MWKTFYDRSKILVLILTLLLLFSLLICIFEVLSYKKLFKETKGEGTEGEVEEGKGEGTDNDGSKGNGEGEISFYVGKTACLKCEKSHLPHVPIFEIYGVTFSPYLRVLVGETYRDGSWFLTDKSSVSAYYGEKIKQIVTEYLGSTLISFQITPIIEFRSCFIPSMINPLLLNFPMNANILYYDDQIIFFSEGIMGSYQVTYINYLFDEELLSSATLIFDERYLDVPSHLMPALRSLALKIAEESNAKTPYEKLKAIEKYLRINYKYDKNYTPPPEGHDPVLWFLFHEKRGVCVHFNSAFVLLARSIGMSARLVVGYLIKPDVENQTVYADQAHAYAEVPFKDFGWVIFDATGEERGGTKRIKIRIKKCECCFDNLTCAPLFEIYGAVKSPYLRVLVGEIYENGVWSILDDSPSWKYSGESIKQLVTNYAVSSPVCFQVIPLSTIKGFIPSANNPLILRTLENENNLLYYVNQQIFFSEEGIDGDYYITYMNYLFDEKMLSLASTPSDPRYLNISQHLFSAIKPLALEIAERYGAETAYEKLRAIEAFLKNNYIYDKNYTPPPEGHDPVLWFLFHEKRGVCVHFNSAFVLLARSLGIPSRLVGGYRIAPEQNYQVVYECQAHAYAEVLFEGLGWIIFDATPPGCYEYDIKPNYTITEITHLDATGVKGSTFRVLGKVTDEYGLGISGLRVKVYLKHNKSDDFGIPVGEGIIKNGVFNITCAVPLDISIGDYFVIAHALSDDKYLGSWSDPQIKIMSGTVLSIEVPERAIVNKAFTIKGVLKEKESNFTIPNERVNIILGSETYTVVTDENGTFSLDCIIRKTGNYTLLVKFDGSTYYLPSFTERKLRVLSLQITPLTKDLLIRGEYAYICGRVHAEDIPGDGERVVVNLREVGTAETTVDPKGYFNVTLYIPLDYPLGLYNLTYLLLSSGYKVSQVVKVVAKTYLLIEAPEKVIINRNFTITGILREEKTHLQISNKSITFFVDSKIYGVAITDDNGSFSISCSWNEPGNYSLLFKFDGVDYYLGLSYEKKLRVLAPRIDILTSNLLIRGEEANFCGYVYVDVFPAENENLIISLNEERIAKTVTDLNGYFNITFLIPQTYTLGLSRVVYFLPSYEYNITQLVRIMARTQIVTPAFDSPLESGKPFNITAILIDDLQQPVRGVTIFLTYFLGDRDFFANSTTNDNGTVLFSVTLSVSKEENVSYSLIFSGNDIYLGTLFSGYITIIPAPRNFIYEVFLPPLIMALGGFSLIYFLYTKGWFRKKITEPPKEIASVEGETMVLSPSTSAKKNINLLVTFPDIKEPFPPVWGLNERLFVRLEIKEDNGAPIAEAALELFVDDDENIHLKSSQNGDVEVYLIFTEKGSHKLRVHFAGGVQWNEAVTEASIRIVDYKEEVVNLFNSFLETASKRYQGLDRIMTAREIQSKLSSQIPEPKNRYLEDIIFTFEVANYSLHMITRREYERIFLAKFNFEG